MACSDERSQKQNKERAIARLGVRLLALQEAAADKQRKAAWREHTRLVRGNPVRVYRGQKFERTE